VACLELSIIPTTVSHHRCRRYPATSVIPVRRPDGVKRPGIDSRRNASVTTSSSTSTMTTSQPHPVAVTHDRELVGLTASEERTAAVAARRASSSGVTPSRPGFVGPTSGVPPTDERLSIWKSVSPTWNASGCLRQSARRVRRAPGIDRYWLLLFITTNKVMSVIRKSINQSIYIAQMHRVSIAL